MSTLKDLVSSRPRQDAATLWRSLAAPDPQPGTSHGNDSKRTIKLLKAEVQQLRATLKKERQSASKQAYGNARTIRMQDKLIKELESVKDAAKNLTLNAGPPTWQADIILHLRLADALRDAGEDV